MIERQTAINAKYQSTENATTSSTLKTLRAKQVPLLRSYCSAGRMTLQYAADSSHRFSVDASGRPRIADPDIYNQLLHSSQAKGEKFDANALAFQQEQVKELREYGMSRADVGLLEPKATE